MEKKIEELGEVQLYFIDYRAIEKIEVLYPSAIAELIKRGDAFGMAIEEEGEIRGALGATFYPEAEHLEILTLFVAESARRRRLGATLLLQTIESVMEETQGELRAVTISFLEQIEGMKEFLTEIGFTLESLPEEGSFFLNRTLLEQSVLNQKKKTNDLATVFLTELSEYEIKELYQILAEEGLAYLSLQELKEARKEYSTVWKDTSGKIRACCIITGKQQLVLSQFYSQKGKIKNGMAVLLSSLSALLLSEENWILEVPCVSASSVGLLKRLFPDAEQCNYIHGFLPI